MCGVLGALAKLEIIDKEGLEVLFTDIVIVIFDEEGVLLLEIYCHHECHSRCRSATICNDLSKCLIFPTS